MASSSVSQESLDRDDYDFIGSRRGGGACRVRAVRGRGWSGPRNDSMESGDMEGQDILPPSGLADVGELGEHDSPTRTPSRLKDKRGRPIHLHKGKTAKDKRKLREKRRSTGVVHLASTESTGDSLDEDEKLLEARRNTTYNEIIDADNPQTPEEDRKGYGTRTRNKSPSDLEADLEDNQDYDSTVSQSETNLTMIGRGVPPNAPPGSTPCPAPQPPPGKFRIRNPLVAEPITHKSSLSSITTTPGGTDSCKEEDECIEEDGGLNAQSPNNGVDMRGLNAANSGISANSTQGTNSNMMTSSAIDCGSSTPTHNAVNAQPQAGNTSSSSLSSSGAPQQRPVSYPSRFVDRDPDMESYMASVTATGEPGGRSGGVGGIGSGSGSPRTTPGSGSPRTTPIPGSSCSRLSGTGSSGGMLKSSLSSRMQNKVEAGVGSVGRDAGGRGAREHVRWRDRSGSNEAALTERVAYLEQALTQEKQENQRLRETLFDRDALVSDLRREIALLHKDLEVADEDYSGLKQENQALLRALASIAVDC